jgi:uncharacterized protein (TIGR00290 family)
MAEGVVLSWSGGKDSALALWTMRAEGAGPTALLTTVTEEDDRVGTHAVPADLVRAQARSVGLPLIEARVPTAPTNEVYEERIAAALADPPPSPPRGRPLAPTTGPGSTAPASIDTVAFGDLFLADIRAYREERLAAIGKRAIFPLWGRDTAALARTFIEAAFGATLVVVDPDRLDPSFVGRRFDAALLADLPPGVDPCGENGEFHTFVDSGPIFSSPIPCPP